MTPTQDERRARRAQIAQQWASYLKQTLADEKMAPIDLVNRSKGAFGTGHLTHWTNGDNTASIEAALLISDLLHRPAAEVLTAAGHDAVAARFTTTETTGPYLAWALWLRLALDHAGVSPEEFAERSSTPTPTVERWLAGQSAPHTADIAIDIAHLLAGDTIAAVAAAGHPKTAALLHERASALENHPIIRKIEADPGLSRHDKEVLIAEVLRRQYDEEIIFERRVADAVRARREALRDNDPGAVEGQSATG